MDVEQEKKVGTVFLAIGFLLLLPFASRVLFVTADYWDHEYVETYREYDIYYFPGPGGLYGIDVKGTNPDPAIDSSWIYVSTLKIARIKIDFLYSNPPEQEPTLQKAVWDTLSASPLPSLGFIAVGAVLRWKKRFLK